MTDTQVTNQYDNFRTMGDVHETIAQIGRMNLLCISGGRVKGAFNSDGETVGVVLPVGHGYRVDVLLAFDDTYTVRRVFARGGKQWVKGELTGVYCDEVGETAYVASCYVNRSFGDDMKDGDR